MRPIPARWYGIFGIAALLLLMQAGILWWFGQPLLCECGVLKAWEGNVWSPGNSQQLSDWYTFSHILHGLLFYWLLSLAFPKMRVAHRVLIALALEIGWEVAENTPYVIELYRRQALAVGYRGDSILNSLSDSFAMLAGFVMARRLPVWAAVAFALFAEALALYMIRDNLALNLLNFIHQFDTVSAWQAGVQ